MSKLTALAVAKARPGRTRREIHDRGCPGLFLVIQPTGHRSWAVRYRYRGLPRKLTLGPVGDSEPADVAPELDTPLSLVAARELATKALRQVKAGIDPAAAKRERKLAARADESDTLRAVCDRYLELTQIERPMRSIAARASDLELICETLGRLPVATITREQLVHRLDSISRERGPVRADRTLMSIKRVLRWHTDRTTGFVSVLATVGRRISIKSRARSRVLNDDELRAVWLAAEKSPFGPYLRFVLLTGARRNEAGGLNRAELHDNGATWIVPWQRYKTGEKTRVDMLIPLSKAAQAIVAAQPQGEFVFSPSGRRPISNFSKAKRDFDAACPLAEPWTIHDLRRTTRTLLARVTDADTAERCLGHALLGQRGTYDRHSYSGQKHDAFEALANEIARIVRGSTGGEGAVDLAAERSKRRR
jgi:integrase